MPQDPFGILRELARDLVITKDEELHAWIRDNWKIVPGGDQLVLLRGPGGLQVLVDTSEAPKPELEAELRKAVANSLTTATRAGEPGETTESGDPELRADEEMAPGKDNPTSSQRTRRGPKEDA